LLRPTTDGLVLSYAPSKRFEVARNRTSADLPASVFLKCCTQIRIRSSEILRLEHFFVLGCARKEPNFLLPPILPATSASLGFLRVACGRRPLEIKAPMASCANTEQSSMLRLEGWKFESLSRTCNKLKNMKKINLVPGRDSNPGR
jgi:hypothetical protein